MAHSLALLPPASSPSLRQRNTLAAHGSRWQINCHRHQQHLTEEQCSKGTVHLRKRRELIYGLIAVGTSSAPEDAHAAGKRRPPPPQPTSPPEEKNDPNVSGVLAKVLASKKRKEAMKEAVAKMREKGKPLNEPSK